MRIDVLTIFPKMFYPVLGESILKRAIEKKLLEVYIHDIRSFSHDKHRKVDDKPFGGGPGMVIKAQPVFEAIEFINKQKRYLKKRVVLLSPAGKKFSQIIAHELSKEEQLILICGHYEGIDERVTTLITDEISIGDYVLTCGEIPAFVLIDSVARLLPDVVGDSQSLEDESFSNGLLEYPHYTRPANFKGLKVPAVLLSGDHKRIEKWRRHQALKKTVKNRPDLVVENKYQKGR